MGNRVLFACAECDTALVWPVDDTPTCALSRPVEEGRFGVGADIGGQRQLVLHREARWRVQFDDVGVGRCPRGHVVGEVVRSPVCVAPQIGLDPGRVVSRAMRGRP